MNDFESRQRRWAADCPNVDIQLEFGRLRWGIDSYTSTTPDCTLGNVKEVEDDLDKLREKMEEVLKWIRENLDEMSTDIRQLKERVIDQYREQLEEIDRNKGAM